MNQSPSPWRIIRVFPLVLLAVMTFGAAFGTAAAADPQRVIDLGVIQLTAPDDWVRKQPQSRIVAYEFAIPATDDDPQDGRATVMAAGGSIKENIDRWIAQFSQPDGSDTAERAKVEEIEVSGQTVHLVDISGTYADRPRPIDPAVERENYRMLGAIIPTDRAQFFLKFYGPERTVAEHAKAFRRMIDEMKVN